MKIKKKFILIITLMLLAGNVSIRNQETKIERKVTEMLLLDYHDFARYGIEDRYYTSPDESRLAYVVFRQDKKASVILDKKELPKYPNILEGSIVFSPDAKTITYIAQEKKNQEIKTFLIINDQESKRYDFIVPGSQIFSPDSKRLAYIAQRGNIELPFVVIDGNEWVNKCTPLPGTFQFSPDSQHLAYFCKNAQGKQLLIYDGTASTPFDEIYSFVFSSDGKHSAYAAQKDKQWCLIVDNKNKKLPNSHYRSITRLQYSPDAKRIAFIAKTDKKSTVILNNKENKFYDDIIGNIFFSFDSEKMAYVAFNKTANKKMVVINGKELKDYDDIPGPQLQSRPIRINLVFSPDSAHLAYVAYNAATKSKFVVMDGKELKSYYDIIEDPMFSKDNKHLYFIGRLLIDMKILRPSSEKKDTEYTTEKRFKNVSVLDEKEYNNYEQTEGMMLSPDSQFVAYKAIQDDLSFVVINGQEGSKYNRIISSIYFDSPNQVHYLAMRANDIYLIREAIK